MARKRKDDWVVKLFAALMIAGFFALSVVGGLIHSKIVYGNYKCAFAHCVVVKDVGK